MAYGIALPGGDAATFGPRGHSFGHWSSAHRAAYLHDAELVWLGTPAGPALNPN